MPNYYITFGQDHRHERLGEVFDRNCVMRVKGEPSELDARGLAFRLFGSVWSFSYRKEPNMDFFPRGFIDVDKDFVLAYETFVANEKEKANNKDGNE